MKKVILMLTTVALLCLIGCAGASVEGTITEIEEDAVIVTSEDGQVFCVYDYLDFIPTGEQWDVGDVVKIRYRGDVRKTSPAVFEEVTGMKVIRNYGYIERE